MQIKAAVVSKRSGPFVIDTVELSDPRPDELIVRVVASGMCQTDLHGRDGYYAENYPGVYGHEGAGVVHAAFARTAIRTCAAIACAPST
jgi:aryl-alcohol dehydrogenase